MSTENPANDEAEAQQSGDFEGLKADSDEDQFQAPSKQCPNCGYIVVFEKE